MRPLTAINGILLGSCVAITVSLAAVLVVFLILGDDYPRLQTEFNALVASLLIFLGMTAISAASFYTLLINHKWRHIAQAVQDPHKRAITPLPEAQTKALQHYLLQGTLPWWMPGQEHSPTARR